MPRRGPTNIAQLRDDAGGEESDVFRQGQPHATNDEYTENGVVTVVKEKGLQQRKGHDESMALAVTERRA